MGKNARNSMSQQSNNQSKAILFVSALENYHTLSNRASSHFIDMGSFLYLLFFGFCATLFEGARVIARKSHALCMPERTSFQKKKKKEKSTSKASQQ